MRLARFLSVVALGCFCLIPALGRAQIRMVDASPVSVPLAQGASATLSFTLRNAAASAASVQLWFFGPGQENPARWTVVAESACPLAWFTEQIVTLAGNAQQQCTYRVTRLGKTVDDHTFSFDLREASQIVQTREFRVGDLTALQTTVRVTRFGAGGQPARAVVEVRNGGPTAVGKLSYGDCIYPGSGTPMTVVGGDCGSDVPAVCFSAGGSVAGFTMANLAVGAVKSCELQWQGTGAFTTFSLPLLELTKANPAGAILLNSNRATDRIGASGAPVVTQLPAGNTWALWLLVVGLVAVAAVARGRAL